MLRTMPDLDDAAMVRCTVWGCAALVDTKDHEAQICEGCTEYVCPEHQVTLDGATWCSDCVREKEPPHQHVETMARPLLSLEEAHALIVSTGLATRDPALASETLRMMLGDDGEAPSVDQTVGAQDAGGTQ